MAAKVTQQNPSSFLPSLLFPSHFQNAPFLEILPMQSAHIKHHPHRMKSGKSSSNPHSTSTQATTTKSLLLCLLIALLFRPCLLSSEADSSGSGADDHNSSRPSPVYYCDHPPRLVDKICRQDIAPTIDLKISNADLVWIGRVLKQYPDEVLKQFIKTSVYTAEVEIYCILKGPRVASVINITEAGIVPSKCHRTELKEGELYVITAFSANNHYCAHDESSPATERTLLKASKACNIDIRLPLEVTAENSKYTCPQRYPGINCNASITTSDPYRDILSEPFHTIEDYKVATEEVEIEGGKSSGRVASMANYCFILLCLWACSI